MTEAEDDLSIDTLIRYASIMGANYRTFLTVFLLKKTLCLIWLSCDYSSYRDVEAVVTGLYGNEAPPLILMGHR